MGEAQLAYTSSCFKSIFYCLFLKTNLKQEKPRHLSTATYSKPEAIPLAVSFKLENPEAGKDWYVIYEC